MTKPSEHQLQSQIIQECELRANQDPRWHMIFHIPNGGHRSKATAGKLKAEGVKAGVPDLGIMVARHGFHGAFLELKITPREPSKAQQAWMEALSAQGYICKVVYDDPEAAIRWIEWYLNGDV